MKTEAKIQSKIERIKSHRDKITKEKIKRAHLSKLQIKNLVFFWSCP